MDYAAKNQQFLSWFWDLASDDKDRRIGAADCILNHVDHAVKNQMGMNEEGTMKIDVDYALKRLIRGISSSRDSARHGFATCLSALLSTKVVTPQIVLPLIESCNSINGKVKGGEERDLMFGKLFAYLAVARSGLLGSSPDAALDVLKSLLDLHSMKGWLREVTSEAILVILYAFDRNCAELKEAMQVLEQAGYFTDRVAEWLPWQLQLALGLQYFSASFKGGDDEVSKGVREAISRMLPEKRLCSEELLRGDLVPVLKTAAAGFPKVHRVWEMIFKCIFASQKADHDVALSRSEKLSSKQEMMLDALLAFVRTHLLVASKEKRALAFRLTVRLAALAPLDFLPLVVNKSVLRSMVQARGNKKHPLNAVAAHAIRDIVNTVLPLQVAGSNLSVLEPVQTIDVTPDDEKARLVLASCLVEHGSANFDSITGIPVVASLLVGLEDSSVRQHFDSLLRILAASCEGDEASEEPAVQEDEDDDAWRPTERSATAKALAALEAMVSLTKNRKLSCRGTLCRLFTAVLIKIACFADEAVPQKGKPSKGRKSKRKDSDDSGSFGDMESLVEVMQVVSKGSSDDSKQYPAAVVNSASGKLLTMLAEIGPFNETQLNSAAAESETEASEEASLLSQAMATAAFLAGSGVSTRLSESTESASSAAAFEQACACIQALRADSNEGKLSPLATALCELLAHGSFQLLAANADLAQPLLDVASVVPALIALKKESDPTDAEESLGTLLDSCFDFLAQDEGMVRAEQLSIKGIATAVKKVWYIVGRELPVGLGLLENVVSAVVGEDGENDEEVDDGGEESDDGVNNNSSNNNQDDGAMSASDSEEEDEEEEVEDSEKEDEGDPADKAVLLSEENAMNFLASEHSDDEDELRTLKSMLPVTEHGEEADAALAHMLEVRKKNRKAGLLEAKRKQLLVRSRAVDILEAIIGRVELPELLVPLLPPLLACIRKVQSGLTSSLSEGRAFESRLRGVIEQRICRKKLVLSHFGDKETDEGITEMVEGMCSQFSKDFEHVSAALRQISQRALMCLTRSAGLGDCDGAKSAVGNTHKSLLRQYLHKKKSRVGSALFDETIQRFADFAVASYADECAVACETAASPYLRAEACRLLLSMAKRFGSLNEVTKEKFAAALPAALKSLSNVIKEAGSGVGDAAGAGAKRLKPTLQCLRELCLLPICAGKKQHLQELADAAGVASKASKGKGVKKAKAKAASVNIAEVIQSLQQELEASKKSLPTLLPLLHQTLVAVGKVGETEVPEKKTTHKRKADSLEEMEENMLAERNAEAMSQKEDLEKRPAKPWHDSGTAESEQKGPKSAKKAKKAKK